MTRPGGAPPARMRDYRVVAEMRETPDLDRLAQLFTSMAMQRAKRDGSEWPSRLPMLGGRSRDEVESSTQEASG